MDARRWQRRYGAKGHVEAHFDEEIMLQAIRWRSLAALAVLSTVSAVSGAQAQQAVVTGRVTNAQGAGVTGANVSLDGTGIGTVAGEGGSYSFIVPAERVQGQQAMLTVRFVGYQPVTRPITLSAGSQTQDFTLRSTLVRLDEVVVTGVAEATSARKLTFSVAKVSEEQLREVPASSPIAALAGKVAGARVSLGTGNPGAAPVIRLRGSTSLQVGASEPLIIVDGVIMRNSIADLDANDIESIEVLKGAAAASFYGSDAANGVINVTTKRGRQLADNQTQVMVRQEYGQSSLPRMIPLLKYHPYTVDAQGNPTGIFKADEFADVPYPTSGPGRFRNQVEEWLTDGRFYSTNAQLSARRSSTAFNGSFTNERNEGILPLTNGLTRRNLRLNLDQGLGPKVDISASVTYGLQNNDFDPNAGGSGSVFFALLQAPQNIDLRYPDPDNRQIEYFPAIPGNNRGNPLYQLANEDFNQRRERILGAFSGRWRPLEWLRVEGTFGSDRLNRQDRTYQFRGYLNTDGEETPGSLDEVNYANWASNSQLSVTATRNFLGMVTSTSRAAYLHEDTRDTWVQAGTNQLNVGQTPDLNAADPSQNYVGSLDQRTRTIDYMFSQGFDIKDRYLIDLLYRRDGSSLFGRNNRWEDFYRVSGAYRITEDFPIPGVQELKIRAARGTAGLRPPFAAQYETYSLVSGGFNKNTLGNKDLRPAIQTEDEFGLNTAFLERFDLELVYAKRLTEGAFLEVPLSLAQSGGFTSQWQNAADVKATTAELSLQTRVWDSPRVSYSFNLTGDRTRQSIVRMDRAGYRPTFTGQSQGQNVFYYREGEQLGVIYGQRWVRSFDELRSMPGMSAADPNLYTVNPLGYLILKTAPNSPIAFVGADGSRVHKIGDVNPDFSWGWANNLRVYGVNIYALFDGQHGGDIYNFSKQWMFQDYRHGDISQAGKPQNQKVPARFYTTGLYNGLEANDYFVEDASYVKLRELSVSYTFGTPVLSRVGLERYAKGLKVALIGRNLYTWTDFTGFDPDVATGGDFNFRIEGFRYPQFRTLTGQIEVTF